MRQIFKPANLLFVALLAVVSCDAADNRLTGPGAQRQLPRQYAHVAGQEEIVTDSTGNKYELVEVDMNFPRLTASAWINRRAVTCSCKASRVTAPRR